MGSNRDVRAIGKCYAPRKMGSGTEFGWTIYVKIMLGSGIELGGVRVWRAGPLFIHTLKLRFKRQIFMIFLVD